MKSLKITATKKKSLTSALDLIEAHVAPAAAIWGDLTPEQREGLLAHSPVLARTLSIARSITWLP